MSFSDWVGLIGLIASVIGVVVGIIGLRCLSKANSIKARNITSSSINQAETLIVNNGPDTYAVIKIAKDVTQQELQGITDSLAATTLDLEKLRKEVEAMPKIYSGSDFSEAENCRNGDIFLKY